MRLAWGLLGLTGCAMQGLTMPPEPAVLPTSSAQDPRWESEKDCAKALDEAQCMAFKTEQQTWAALPALEQEQLRLFLVGDVGHRHGDAPTEDAVRVRDAGAFVCGGSCDGAVLLGDNVYPSGVNDETDSQFLDQLVGHYLSRGSGFVDRVYFSQGNHDWGALRGDRDRAQRLHRDIAHRLGDDVQGAAHFWQAELGPVHLASLDSNYFVRGCSAGSPGKLADDDEQVWAAMDFRCVDESTPWAEALRPLLGDGDPSSTIAVGHHPWYGSGKHGTAGWFRDVAFFSLGKGQAWRAVLEQVVRPRSSLFVSGHDHYVAVHLDPRFPKNLQVTVGSGSEVAKPGSGTGNGKPYYQDHLVLEGHCKLGFAIAEHDGESLAVQVYTLNGDQTKECSYMIERRRGEYSPRLGEQVDLSGAPAQLQDSELTCRRFHLGAERWEPVAQCEDLRAG